MDTNSVKVELVETQTTQVNTGEVKLFKQSPLVAESLLLFLFGFTIVCAIAVSFAKGLSQKIEERNIITRSPKVPCPKCQYFNNNAHLRCAVHPTSTMTEQAAHCSDFTPRKK